MSIINKNSNIKVLMYHRVVDETSDEIVDLHSITDEDFRNQLKILEQFNYTPITFEDYHLYRQGKLTLPKKPIILTFDDGYLDTYSTALPILQEFNMRAVFFVLGNRNLQYASWDQDIKDEKRPLMSDEQIAEARSEGFEIGAHTMSHIRLPELNRKEMKKEIEGSKKSIESILGEKILSFSYPYGRLDHRVRSSVVRSGFKFACGVYTGPPTFGDDLYDIRRLAVNNKTGSLGFLIKLLTPYQYAEWLYSKFRHRKSKIETNVYSDQEASVDEYDLTPTNNY